MEIEAFNYRAVATLDDSSCFYIHPGCMDPTAFNYDPTANRPASCVPVRPGCMAPAALNYYPDANVDDGSCLLAGCTDSTRLNYDAAATTDNGMCTPLFPGCTNSRGSNYSPMYNVDDGTCRIPGCLHTDAEATFNVACFCAGTCGV